MGEMGVKVDKGRLGIKEEGNRRQMGEREQERRERKTQGIFNAGQRGEGENGDNKGM